MMNVSIDSIAKMIMLKKVNYDTIGIRQGGPFTQFYLAFLYILNPSIQGHLISVINNDVIILNLLNKLLS